jgi:hypothetical protein
MVTLNGTDIGEIFTDNINFYNLTLNTTQLGIGIHFLNIIAYKDNYTALTELLTLNVYQIETGLTLFVDGEDITLNSSITRYPNEILNITVSYDRSIPFGHIPGATVDVNGSGISELLDEVFDNYSILINTNDLNQGVNFLTIFARKTGYEAHSILLVIQIIQIETDLSLFADGEDITSDPSITRYPNEILNITVSYDRSVPFVHIPGATVDINGSGISELLPEAFDNYSILIDTDDLNQGANFLTIYARKIGYEPQTILLVIQIIQIETDLILFLDGEDKTSNPSIIIYTSQTLNITISYTDSIGAVHIPNAIVDINGSGTSEILVESFNNYSVLINTADLNQGVNFLTIFVRKDGYEAQTILLVIEIIQIETDLTLFLDGIPRNDGDTIQVEFNDLINITVYFKDNITRNYLSGASISLLGLGSLNETGQHYNITLSASDLGQRINFLTVSAQLDNYEPQSIQFSIEIVERESELELLLDNDQITLDPVIEVMIGNILNLTVYYTDNQTGFPITGALVQLIGEGDILNFTEGSNQYSIYLNTIDLKIGVSLFSIVAHANNFQIRTIDLRITTTRIKITTDTLSGEPIATGLEGDTVQLRIILNNTNILPSGELIKNATVTYKWDYGQGELTEIDGIYEIDLVDVPSGTYIITITASAGDDYTFESYEITLTIGSVTPPDFSMLFIISAGALVVLVGGFTLYEVRFKYPATVRKSRKIRKKIKKGKKTKPIKEIASREDLIKIHLESNVETIQIEKKTENGMKDK